MEGTHTDREGDDSEIRLIETDDGSHSLYLPGLKETYHSFHGAVQESLHVFVREGWRYYLDLYPLKGHRSATLLEIGFGTGLNALLTLLEMKGAQCHGQSCSLRYRTLEPYPLSHDLVSRLNYEQHLGTGEGWLEKLHSSPWDTPVPLTPYFELHKSRQKLEEVAFEPLTYDVVYFDAFAPSKQAELWSKPLLEKVCNAMSSQSVLVTYCAKGQLKRDLRALGLSVETLPGPPGKKEMVRASKS